MSITQATLSETIVLSEETTVPVGTEVEIILTFLGENKNNIYTHNDNTSVIANPKGGNLVRYVFKGEDKIHGKVADPSLISYLIGGIDINNDNVISKHEETTIDIIDCCPCEAADMVKIKNQYLEIIDLGKKKQKLWAAEMLEHWINGGGKDRLIDVNLIRKFDVIIDAEDTIRSKIEDAKDKPNRDIIKKIKEGEDKVYYIAWEELIAASAFTELYYASGNSTLIGRIALKATKHENTVKMQGTLEFHWSDPYDWHPGLSAYIPGIGNIKDEDAAKYEDAGCAKKFNMYSFWHQSFVEEYKIDNFIYFDSSDINWGKIYRGRAPLSKRTDDKSWFKNNNNAMTDAHGNIYPGLKETRKHGYNPYEE